MVSIKKNFIYQFSYQILSILLPLLTTPYISRVFGANGMGEYSYTYTIAYYVFVLAMLGFDTYGQRVIVMYRNDRDKMCEAFWQIYFLQIITSSFVSILYWIYVILFAKEHFVLSSIQYIVVLGAFTNIVWLFEGVEDFKRISLRNIEVKIVSVILIFLFVRKPSDIWIYALIISGSTFAGNLLFFIYSRKYISLKRFDVLKSFKHFKGVLLVFVPQIGITIFMQMDKLMIGQYSTMRELGYYQNAEKIVNLPITLILTVGTVMMPRIAAFHSMGDKSKISSYIVLSMKWLMIGSIGCMFGIMAVSRDFVILFSGSDFAGSYLVVSSLALIIIFMAWENVLQKQYMVPLKKDKFVAVIMSLAAVINVIINFLLIPKMNATGAIIGSVISHIFICMTEGIYLRKELPVLKMIRKILPYLLCGSVMLICVILFADYVNINSLLLKLTAEVALGVIIYVSLCCVVLRLQGDKLKNIFKSSK